MVEQGNPDDQEVQIVSRGEGVQKAAYVVPARELRPLAIRLGCLTGGISIGAGVAAGVLLQRTGVDLSVAVFGAASVVSGVIGLNVMHHGFRRT